MPLVAFPCASMSISKTFLPKFAKHAPKFTVVVVLPTPPFWFATEIIRVMCVPPSYLIGCLFGNPGFLGYFLGVSFFF